MQKLSSVLNEMAHKLHMWLATHSGFSRCKKTIYAVSQTKRGRETALKRHTVVLIHKHAWWLWRRLTCFRCCF